MIASPSDFPARQPARSQNPHPPRLYSSTRCGPVVAITQGSLIESQTRMDQQQYLGIFVGEDTETPVDAFRLAISSTDIQSGPVNW